LYSAPNSEMSYPNLRTEPAVVTGVTDGTGTSYDGAEANRVEILDEGYENSTAGLLKQFQTEFNKMVESVKKYGGFYVGRYETSNGNEANLIPKLIKQIGIHIMKDRKNCIVKILIVWYLQ